MQIFVHFDIHVLRFLINLICLSVYYLYVILDSNLSDFLFPVYFVCALYSCRKSKCVRSCLGFD